MDQEERFYKNLAYFHDGTIFFLNHKKNELHVAMESADLEDGSRIIGILHVYDIQKIKQFKHDYFSKIKIQYDSAEILDFEIKNNTIFLGISLLDYGSDRFAPDYVSYTIEAKKIQWEEIPGISSLFE